MKIDLSSQEVAAVVDLLEKWGDNEIYLDRLPSEKKFVDQDGLMRDTRVAIEALAQKTARRYANELRPVAKQVRATMIDLARCVVTITVVKAFGETNTGKAGCMDVLLGYLAPKDIDLASVIGEIQVKKV